MLLEKKYFHILLILDWKWLNKIPARILQFARSSIMKSFGERFFFANGCPSWRKPHAWDAVSKSSKSYFPSQNSTQKIIITF